MTTPEQLSKIASDAADQIAKQPGVNAVVVLVMRCDEVASITGSSFRSANIAFDHVMGNVIEGLASLRQNATAAAHEAKAKARESERPEGSSN